MKYVCDFETTTDPNDCRVWAVGIMEITVNYKFTYYNNIQGFFNYFNMKKNSTVYFHNLKFDGEFIINYLLKNDFKWTEKQENKPKTFTTLISDKGQHYTYVICFNSTNKLTLYDSLKLIPLKVEEIPEAFGLPEQKTNIDYNKKRKIGYQLNPVEIEYLKYDCLIVTKALHFFFEKQLSKMTIGSNALFNYKKIVGKNFERWFPTPKYDTYVRKAYKGGFTYVNKQFKNKEIKNGIVLDVNSLYPYVMYDCPMPYGEPIYFTGEYKQDNLYNLYVQCISCSFELNKDFLPTIQLKNNLSFIPTEYIETSGDEEIVLYLTNVDLKLFLEHYYVSNVEYIDGWKFKSSTTLFTSYIDYWMEVKKNADINKNKGMRKLAKLMLNNLYGKFALNPNVQSKIPVLVDDVVSYKAGPKETRKPIYIPIGVFVTSYARNITIRSAQLYYNRFLYADTDSLHLLGDEIPENLKIDSYELGAWKIEKKFSKAKFIRAKCYVEEVDGELEITCAGMPKECYKNVTWENFSIGQSYDGKLQPSHVNGGIVLEETKFTIKKDKNTN